MKFTAVITLATGLLLGSTAFGNAYCPLKDKSSIRQNPAANQIKVASVLEKLGKSEQDTSSATKTTR